MHRLELLLSFFDRYLQVVVLLEVHKPLTVAVYKHNSDVEGNAIRFTVRYGALRVEKRKC